MKNRHNHDDDLDKSLEETNYLMDALALENACTYEERLTGSRFWPTKNKPWKKNKGINEYSKRNYEYETCDLNDTSILFEPLKDYVYRSSDSDSYSPMFLEGARSIKQKQKGRMGEFFINESKRKLGLVYGGVDHLAGIGRIEIVKIETVKNHELWKAYQEEKTRVQNDLQNHVGIKTASNVNWFARTKSDSLPILDEQMGECWVFHGTTPENIELIKQQGFMCCEKKAKGFFNALITDGPLGVLRSTFGGHGALGLGAYFSDTFAKAIGYTACLKCKQPYCECYKEGEFEERQFFICRAVLGKVYITTGKEMKHNTEPPNQNNSTVGEYKPNEILIPRKIDPKNPDDEWQPCPGVYPEFVINFKLVHGKQPSLIKKEKNILLPTPHEIWTTWRSYSNEEKEKLTRLCDVLLGYYRLRAHERPLDSKIKHVLLQIESAILELKKILDPDVFPKKVLSGEVEKKLAKLDVIYEDFRKEKQNSPVHIIAISAPIKIKNPKQNVQNSRNDIFNYNSNAEMQSHSSSEELKNYKKMVTIFYEKILGINVASLDKEKYATSALATINKIEKAESLDYQMLLTKTLFESFRCEYNFSYKSFKQAFDIVGKNKKSINSFFESLPPRITIEIVLKLLVRVGELNEISDVIVYLKELFKKAILVDKEFQANTYQKIWYSDLQKEGKKKVAEVTLNVTNELLNSVNSDSDDYKRLFFLRDRIEVLPYTDCGCRLRTEIEKNAWNKNLQQMFDGFEPEHDIPVRWLNTKNEIENSFLNQEITKQLFTNKGYINQNNPQDGSDCFVKAIKNSEGKIISYAKFFPRYPLRQLGAECLRSRLNGNNSYSTLSFIKHPRSGIEYVVMFSKPLEKTVYEYQFPPDEEKGDPEISNLEDLLDEEAFSEAIMERYILRYGDEKTNNTALVNISPDGSPACYRLLHFDQEGFLPASCVDDNGKVYLNSFALFF